MTETSNSELKGHYARTLTQEEAAKLAKDTVLVSEFKRLKLEAEAQKNWDLFYKRNETRFFKDRHWTKREFEELAASGSDVPSVSDSERPVLLEIGCGVGNFVFPLIEERTSYYIYACDFSPRAVQFVKAHSLYDQRAIKAFQCDITKERLVDNVPREGVDVVTMIFVLSAIQPDKMSEALRNVHEALKPGGLVLFRDYGLFDQAMLRFAPGHKIDTNFYVRQDGTRAFYFSEQFLERLFLDAGYEVVSNEYVCRETVNKKEGICVPRIFVQAKFRKPRNNSQEESYIAASS
ncbi:tRNA N(3)-cytidine methyltransferase METTL6 [Dermacentor andersoni]|uniref:tRNA N(3)-cytidine methyltransferase METTL6 n=1 Tax=Dermacentor andersoni TaxID=34620 RepID=UPI002155E52A|nr:tRNA N(3)-methylcytidine methyltransferase METTL6-like [Dermacentor andersoni]